ncbi:Hpt domain-containing protein [Aliiroseovarius sp.]|uniref:Hpt domain-containing protein n=1 Tax=Aliiroseovarius sp. TaxID=1872442 RepID=UPI002624C141|nr:Hpt domain-containing protein [Aliiroseovarius sp.]
MISWNRVNELRDEIGEEDFAEVAEIFLEEVEEVIDRLRCDPQPAQFEQDLHFLKSSSLNLGFDALSKICSTGERQAAAGEFDPAGLGAVFSTFEASKEAFLAR